MASNNTMFSVTYQQQYQHKQHHRQQQHTHQRNRVHSSSSSVNKLNSPAANPPKLTPVSGQLLLESGIMFAEDNKAGTSNQLKITQMKHSNSRIHKNNNNNSLIRPQVRRAIAQCDTWEVGVCDPSLDHPIISTPLKKQESSKKSSKHNYDTHSSNFSDSQYCTVNSSSRLSSSTCQKPKMSNSPASSDLKHQASSSSSDSGRGFEVVSQQSNETGENKLKSSLKHMTSTKSSNKSKSSTKSSTKSGMKSSLKSDLKSNSKLIDLKPKSEKSITEKTVSEEASIKKKSNFFSKIQIDTKSWKQHLREASKRVLRKQENEIGARKEKITASDLNINRAGRSDSSVDLLDLNSLQKNYDLRQHNLQQNMKQNTKQNPKLKLSATMSHNLSSASNLSKLKYISPESSNISRSQSVMLQNMTLPKPGKSGSRKNFYNHDFTIQTDSAFKHFGEDNKIQIPDFKKNFKAEIDHDEIVIEERDIFRMNNQTFRPVQNSHLAPNNVHNNLHQNNLHQSSPDISSLISTHSNSSSIETTPSSQIPMSASRQNSTNHQIEVTNFNQINRGNCQHQNGQHQNGNNQNKQSHQDISTNSSSPLSDHQVQQKVLRLQRDQQQQINQIRDANCVVGAGGGVGGGASGNNTIQSSTATLDAIPDCIQFQEHRYVQAKNSTHNTVQSQLNSQQNSQQLHQRKRWSQAGREKNQMQQCVKNIQNMQNSAQIRNSTQNLQNPQYSTLNQRMMQQGQEFSGLNRDSNLDLYNMEQPSASDAYHTLPNMRTPKSERSSKLSKVSAGYSNQGAINSKMDQHRRLLQCHSNGVKLNTGSQQQHLDVMRTSSIKLLHNQLQTAKKELNVRSSEIVKLRASVQDLSEKIKLTPVMTIPGKQQNSQISQIPQIPQAPPSHNFKQRSYQNSNLNFRPSTFQSSGSVISERSNIRSNIEHTNDRSNIATSDIGSNSTGPNSTGPMDYYRDQVRMLQERLLLERKQHQKDKKRWDSEKHNVLNYQNQLQDHYTNLVDAFAHQSISGSTLSVVDNTKHY